MKIENIDGLTEDEAKSALREAVALLYANQWAKEIHIETEAGTGWTEYECPNCMVDQYFEHHPSCEIGKILRRFTQ